LNYFKRLFFVFGIMFMVSGCKIIIDGWHWGDLFPDNSSLANSNDSNADELIDTLIGYNINKIIPDYKIVGNSKGLKKPTLMQLAINEIKAFKYRNSTKAYRVSRDYCERGELYIDDDYYDGIKYTYDNCLHKGYYYDGIIIRKKSGSRLEIRYDSDFKVKSRYGSGYLIIRDESEIILTDTFFDKYKIELNIVTRSNGDENGLKDAEFIYDDIQNSMYQTKGIIYLNDLQEYAKFDTSHSTRDTPLVYDEDNNIVSGEFYYIFKDADLHVIIDDGDVEYDWEYN